MLIDARSLPANTSIETDVCVVGAGVAGLTLALQLNHPRLRVSVLEAGGAEEDSTQSLYRGENVGLPYYPLETAQAHQLGGSSVRWHVELGDDEVGARMRPLDPIDFEERSWVAHSGWPFRREHLEPYYRGAETICRLEPATYHVEQWEDRQKRPRLPFPDPQVETIIYKFCRRDVFAREYPDQVSRAPNITTYLHAHVLEIVSNAAADHVESLRVSTPEGNRFEVKARYVVLAAGGVETPRLLLLSNRRHGAGLGNRHDVVGRFFMEHLHFWSGMLVVDDPGILQRMRLYTEVQNVNGVAFVGKLALNEQVLRREKLLNQNVQLFLKYRPDPFRYRPVNVKPVASLKAILKGRPTQERVCNVIMRWDDVVTFGYRRIRTAVRRLPRKPVLIFANMSEQVPNPESRVTLSDDRDALGRRRPRLNWQISRQDMASVGRTQEIVAGALERIGVGRFYRQLKDCKPPSNMHGGYHHMGTTRMHVDPRFGVVDANSRVHGIDNLYVAGPSVFPTGGYANPVLTVVALTLRLAEHLAAIL